MITSDRRQVAAEVDLVRPGCLCLPLTSQPPSLPNLQVNKPLAALQKGFHLLLQVGGEQALSVPSLHHGVAGPGGQDSWP